MLTVFLFACLIAVIMVCPARGGDDSGRIHWKPIDEGEVKLDGKPPIASTVYLPDKKSRKKDSYPVLVLLGRRYLMLDVKSKLVYAVFPTDLDKQGSDVESGDLAQESRLVPSADWTSRDVGPAELIKLTLGDYNRVLEVELPHPVDLRGLYVY
jgi:hypothetical protein